MSLKRQTINDYIAKTKDFSAGLTIIISVERNLCLIDKRKMNKDPVINEVNH